MLDPKNGEIRFCQTQFVIRADLRKQTLQAGIPELIISSYIANEYSEPIPFTAHPIS